MKNWSIYVALLIFAAPMAGLCQTNKIGYIDVAYIYDNLPDHQNLMAEVQATSMQYQNLQKEKLADYQKKLEAYQKLQQDNTSMPIQKDKAKELEDIQQSMQQFQLDAEQDIKLKYNKKFTEIQAKVSNAITAYAKEHGYSFVARLYPDQTIGETQPFLLYVDQDANDITEAILSKLGVKTAIQTKRKAGIQGPIKK
ncbi:OmpH family outer membrane protein [Dyadobacter sp. CY107]|uniref:OmpH family outer membrane protein n=1 Tax=Dyadobacter fanqingshengii TaxID=2906443 RepID=UPI001F26B2EF|nr:OmpH family outer membrane protein [Dyadobacter fanqingshengii]MCF2505197.1 OmpH family outer membrane protein [Dyadobacter fanqingshengii]